MTAEWLLERVRRLPSCGAASALGELAALGYDVQLHAPPGCAFAAEAVEKAFAAFRLVHAVDMYGRVVLLEAADRATVTMELNYAACVVEYLGLLQRPWAEVIGTALAQMRGLYFHRNAQRLDDHMEPMVFGFDLALVRRLIPLGVQRPAAADAYVLERFKEDVQAEGARFGVDVANWAVKMVAATWAVQTCDRSGGELNCPLLNATLAHLARLSPTMYQEVCQLLQLCESKCVDVSSLRAQLHQIVGFDAATAAAYGSPTSALLNMSAPAAPWPW